MKIARIYREGESFKIIAPIRANSMKRKINRMRSRAVQLKESKSIIFRRRFQNADESIYSDPEDDACSLDFDFLDQDR